MPVQVYASSPINASKASGITPKTALPEENESRVGPPPPTTSTGSPTAYPPAQPGARPSLPVQTGVPQPSDRYRPTSTQEANTSPPPPQPGAVPSPPGGQSRLPPPPKAGESIQQSQTQTVPMPPQMSYPPPATTYPAQGGSSTSTATAYSPNVPQPTFLQSRETTEPDFSHPPGYQQNVNAADFNRDQREAHNASFAQNTYQGYEEESVWNTAKKWAAAAGDSLAAAENEVWKRINKD
ncbi:hypothetical protein TARUN_9449 [Trichoderma arundinaceum]|uniref:Uncharacterized protein n=1 Tax=Trichoderma arundinaceum TaxID=490622 RepID=A0A395NA65_TRIAR|nr:hypothetical protein TARUN_9449 [Trichoderma arundinaceum]